MVRHVTVKRSNPALKKLSRRSTSCGSGTKTSLDDRGTLVNQTLIFAHQFRSMLELSLVMTKGALLRDEFRGAHFKPEFPRRDDDHWLKTTIASYSPEGPLISYRPVDTRHLKPIQRDYTKAKKVKPQLDNIPREVILPI